MVLRLADGRREELLDGVMRIIAARGFSEASTSEIARELKCSVSTLYKIAPSKESLVALAIKRWAHQALDHAETCAQKGTTAADRARRYYKGGVSQLRPLSHAFRRDMERFEASRMAYLELSNGFIDRFDELLEEAMRAGEIRRVHTCFLSHVFRQLAIVVRDEDILEECGLTAEEALLEIDRLIWEGLPPKPPNA